MKQKHILSIAFDIPGEQAEYVSVDSKQSLADGDIVVIRPDISEFYSYSSNYYQGKPSLSENSSFQLKEAFQHWQREIATAVAAGKTVFVFLTEREEVFVDTGQRSYSGTGRNRQTTNFVNEANNYQLLSLPVSLVSSSGKSMKLAPKADIISPYWSTFEKMTNYQVHIEGKVTQPLLLTRDGSRNVAAIIRYKDSPGHIVLLPLLEIDTESMTEKKKEGTFWNKKGMQFGAQLTTALIAIDKQLRSDYQATPTPSWVSDSLYALSREQELEVDLLNLQEDIQNLTQKAKTLQVEIKKEASLKRLLYEKGTQLEDSIHDALQLLGFSTSRFRDSESEFDVVFEAEEGRFIGEAEGKDSKAINIDKLRQLEMNIHEDLARDEVTEPAKAVLFGNAYRLIPPTERKEHFTEKCTSAAKRSGIALVRTSDLFEVARYLKSTKDDSFAADCRTAIFATSGDVVFFPEVPEKGTKRETKQTTKESSFSTEGAPSVES